jgi:hypothetical protein
MTKTGSTKKAPAPPATSRAAPGAAAARSVAPGPARVLISAVMPQIDGGRFPIKRVVGETVAVGADIVAEGHDRLAAVVRFRRVGEDAWQEVAMHPLVNDRWEAAFTVTQLGRYEYTVHAWVDDFASWVSALAKKFDAGHDVHSELLEGAELMRRAARRTSGPDAPWLQEHAAIVGGAGDPPTRVTVARSAERAACRASPVCRSSSSANAHATVPGTSCFRARAAMRQAGTEPSPSARRACPTSPPWGLTCCICRRSIRSA